MQIAVTLDQVLLLAPNARSNYCDAFSSSQKALDDFQISASPLRTAHFMAQVLHESGGLAILYENLNYSAARLPVVWPTRFRPKGPLDPVEYAHNPQKLAQAVYGGRMGNVQPDDGYYYRGRGLLQTTGKAGYESATTGVRRKYTNAPEFQTNPEDVLAPEWCVCVAAAEWFEAGCNALADGDSIRGVTKAINGGLIGLDERVDWLARTKFVWH